MQMQTTIANDNLALTTSGPPLPPPPPDQPEYFQRRVPNYALLFFDHLFSEYLTLKPAIPEANVPLFELLHQKRINSELTWSDIYTFDLALVDQRPLENLIRKAFDARAKYRSIAGQKEFDEYLASKPPDLTTILVAPNNHAPLPDQPNNGLALAPPPPPLPGAPPDQPPAGPPVTPMPQSAEIIQRVLRADIRYLLSKFYLYYAMLPERECYREELTTRAVRMTKWTLGTIVALMVVSVSVGLLVKAVAQNEHLTLRAFGELLGAFGPVVGSVAFAGIVGGCVSMLQRIQSAPSEGDALFNLAALTNGWRGLSLSPLYGGIFASLLFILFAGGILKGSVFPDIKTVDLSAATQTAHDEKKTNPAPVEPVKKDETNPSGDAKQQPTPEAPATKDTPTQTTLVNRKPDDNQVLKINDFLRQTGPRDGVAFALLMIWSFIAGFAERLVPDTLNRLVAKNEALQGTNA